MNRSGVEQVFGPAVGIIIFVVSAVLLLILIINALSGFQGSFEGTICKFNAWMRAATIGNPFIQSLIGSASYVTGGFTGFTVSSITIPLVCTPAPELPEKEFHTVGEVLEKIAEEAVNCWDQFGLGKWDPLMMSPQGQSFTCYEQTLSLNCTRQEILLAWGEDYTPDVVEVVDLSAIDINEDEEVDTWLVSQSVLNKYLGDNYYKYLGYEKTYADILPENAPLIGRDTGGYYITCDGEPHTYYISLYFVDSFNVFAGAGVVPLVCITLTADQLTSDSLYLCFIETNGGN